MGRYALVLAAVLAAPFIANAQAGASISVFGSMAVSEGGRARAQGYVEDTGNGAIGRFGATFDTGEVMSIWSTRIDDVFVPGETAGFSGPGVVALRRQGRIELLKGEFFALVDDLESVNHFDQIFIQFVATTGEVFVRHGTLDRGDVVLVRP